MERAGGWTIGGLVECELTELDRVLEELLARDDYEPIRDVVGTLVPRMRGTLRHLIDIGVGYLSLHPGVPTLSGGESQRVKMARQLDCDLVDLSSTSWTNQPWAPSARHRSPHRHVVTLQGSGRHHRQFARRLCRQLGASWAYPMDAADVP